MHLKSKKHILNLVGVAAVGCEWEVVWLFYSRLKSTGKYLLCYYSLLCLLPAWNHSFHSNSRAITMVALRDRRVKLHSTALWQRIRQYNFKATCHYEAELSNLLVLLRLPAPVAIQLSLLLWLPAHNRILIVLRTVNGIPSDDHSCINCWQLLWASKDRFLSSHFMQQLHVYNFFGLCKSNCHNKACC